MTKKALSVENKIALGGVAIAFFSVIVGSVLTYNSLQQSQKSLDILANKEAVNLDPAIGIDALMYKNGQLKAPRLFIYNDGKVPAINVVLQIIRRQFDGKEFVGAEWGSGKGSLYIYDEIKTYDSKEIELPSNYVEDPSYNTIEVRVYYMRAYDKKSYAFRTFYFYGPGDWAFKTWYNIKKAEAIEGNPFAKIIEASMDLPADLYDKDFKNLSGSILYPLQSPSP